MGIKTEYQKLNEAINHQRHTYSQQLKAYLRTYTSGELNIRVGKTNSECVVELMREIIHKGSNRNPNANGNPGASGGKRIIFIAGTH